MPKTTPPDLCYVYCALEGPPPALPSAGMPDGDAPRRLALDADVSLITSRVPAAVYAADVLEPRLSDLDWVSAAGGAHHAVVDALAEAGATVLPFRLFTLFSSDEKALTALGDTRPAMRRAFDRVRGKQEWVLRIGAPHPTSAPAVSTTPRRAALSSGKSFLQAKADAKRAVAARAQRVKEDAAAAFEALEQLADEARLRSVEASGTLVLDAAFLVPRDRIDAMRETLTRRAERLLAEGCPVSLTGPWPPYSFAAMDAAK